MEPRASYRALARVDAWANRVFTSRHNPLYHSGALAVAMLGVLIVTGLYLLLFYRIGSPYSSIQAIDGQPWAGSWIRALHRFASDAALVAAGVHAFRMYAQRRTWGPRALAWISGVFLVGVFLVSGWTGFLLIWDTQAQLLAVEGARLMDALPLFSEPIGRSFVGEGELPDGFFFVMLFAHIALPIAVALLVWVHVARVARPVLLPARPVLWSSIIALTVLAVVWPVDLLPEANVLRFGQTVTLDWFYNFWLPVTATLPAWSVWLGALLALTGLCLIPRITRPTPQQLPAPAVVNERTCTGCEQCVSDCPYDAITMVERSDGRPRLVASVNVDLCTSCGICIGSCPPMAIGPSGVTARNQIAEVRAFLRSQQPHDRDVVVVGCTWSAARVLAEQNGASFLPVSCVGALHSSTVELLLKGGAGGVLVVGCAEHDGRTREGVTWTEQRLFEGRKAELKDRVDKQRVRLVQASLGEGVRLHDAALAFAAEIDALAVHKDQAIDLVGMCRSPAISRLPEDAL